ncbi:hypothetical protein [Methylobacterium terrae]|uniref:hypothetical protein n=1 Tax=Methylobacterium terrae TaxID=2202827 RepID=UPI0013A548F6|nr:hypothetical protein [Methylobacterium terrae]
MDYWSLLTAIPVAAAIANFIFGLFKFYVDFNGSLERYEKNKISKKFIMVSIFILFLSLVPTIFLIYYDTLKAPTNKQAIRLPPGTSTLRRAETTDQTHTNKNIENDSATTNSSTVCNISKGDGYFYDVIASCSSEFSCAASEYLCTSIAQSSGSGVTRDITCPIGLGRSLSLDRRRDISDHLRLRRCYPESYSWLAGLRGPEADNARGAWRAKVCPDVPDVFSDPRFAQLGPITDGACTR